MVVEQIIREKAKDTQFAGALKDIEFEEIITKLNKNSAIPNFQDLLNLNTMRNNAQHRNIVASRDDVKIKTAIVERFLGWSYKQYFGKDYAALQLEEFVNDQRIRDYFLQARQSVEKNDLAAASQSVWHALGSFKANLYAFFYDPRAEALKIPSEGEGTNLSGILGDIVLKLSFMDDPSVLVDLFQYQIGYPEKDKPPYFIYSGPAPVFTDANQFKKYYDRALGIVLRYQDRFPSAH